MSLQVDAGLELSLDAHTRALDRNTHERRRASEIAKAQTPADVRLQQSGTSGSSGDLALIFAGPDTGYYWMVRRLVVGGAAWSTAVTGTAEVYLTAINSPIYPSIRDLADLADQSASLPNKAFYGDHQFVVQANENVVVVIHTPAATTLYKASLQFQQFRTLPVGSQIEA